MYQPMATESSELSFKFRGLKKLREYRIYNDLKELPQLVKDPKVLLSFFTAFLYWVILAFRLSSLRRGQKIAFGTVLVLAFLLVTLMSSHYLPAGLGKTF